MAPRSRLVQAGEVRLHYLDWGENGPPVVLLHGSRRLAWSWNAVARELQNDFRVLSLNARGHGRSSRPRQGYSDRHRVADLANFMEALGLEGAFGIAHSIGASTMALCAAERPRTFEKVVLVEPPYDGPAHYARVGVGERRRMMWPSRAHLEARLRENQMTRRWSDEVLRDVLDNEVTRHADGSVEMKFSSYAYEPRELLQDRFNLPAIAARIRAAVLLIYGEESRYPEEEIMAFTSALPARAEIVKVPGAAHAVYMDRPDAVAQAAREFFLGTGITTSAPAAVGAR